MRHPLCDVVGVADTILLQAESLAAEVNCAASTDWTKLIRRDDIDAVVVATPHKYLASISAAALAERKHVLCEKPGARTPAEAEAMLRVLYDGWQPAETDLFPRARKIEVAKLVIGFTLRHHRSISRARELLERGEIGKPMYAIGRYGHGGRPGYEQEWRHVPELAGGGELLDQGVHLIDLSRCFFGEFSEVTGFVGDYFWGARGAGGNGGVEDNAFLLLRSAEGTVASLQASWTQWKNMFSFEVYGEDGFLHAHGLGGSYGQEKLLLGRRSSQGGAPDTSEIDLSAGSSSEPQDDVWALEWQAFVNEVLGRDNPEDHASTIKPASALDAWEALRIVEAAYGASKSASVIPLARPATPRGKALITVRPAI
jgi:predicted dehydrogenase